jgi:cell division protein FtsI/penicillin-binding protein 2
MLIKHLFPSMFHRRLLLLAAASGLAALPLAWQLTRLTIARNVTLRTEAESKLVRRQWTPTVRGSVLDRKGRILAQDRPSYDVFVSFPVINGDWAQEQAVVAARKSFGRAGWVELSPKQREEVISKLLGEYQLHLENGWNKLAATLGITRAELDARRDAVVTQLHQRQQAVTERRLEKEKDEALKRGEKSTPEQIAAMEKRASSPIAEFRQAHVLASRVTDDLGFACGALGSEEITPDSVELEPGLMSVMPPVPILPGLNVTDSGDRDYPFEAVQLAVDRSSLPTPVKAKESLPLEVEGVACHILGRLRDKLYGDTAITERAMQPESGESAPAANTPTRISPGDASRRRTYLAANPAVAASVISSDGEDRGAYRDGDRVGDAGVEGAYEMRLRGARGTSTTRLDSGKREFVAPIKGEDVTLTLDVMLQARVQAAMSPELGLAQVQPWHQQESSTQKPGDPLYGAAVVLDVDTGEILAAVSTPTFTRRQLKESPDSIFQDRLTTPYVNRCWEKPYPPGSIIKAAVLAGAVTLGSYRADERIACNGFLIPNKPSIYRCHIYKHFSTTHSILMGHDLDGTEALMLSCNIFFYTMGKRLGPESLVKLYREYGICTPFDLGAGPEFAGQLGRRNDGSDLSPADAILMAIGQGPVTWTPLHAANNYATLARSGTELTPTLVKGRNRPQPRELGLDPRGIQMAMDGLGLVVNGERGTGRHLTIDGREEPIFNAKGVTIWGKTGTAAAPEIRGRDPDGAGPGTGELLEKGDHSWFVILAGRDRPRYAIAVVIDYGGSGGKVSGPIANQIVHALIAEGYL